MLVKDQPQPSESHTNGLSPGNRKLNVYLAEAFRFVLLKQITWYHVNLSHKDIVWFFSYLVLLFMDVYYVYCIMFWKSGTLASTLM